MDFNQRRLSGKVKPFHYGNYGSTTGYAVSTGSIISFALRTSISPPDISLVRRLGLQEKFFLQSVKQSRLNLIAFEATI